MKKEIKLFNAITGIRDDLLEEAQNTRKKPREMNWKSWTVAASIILAMGFATIALFNNWLPVGGSSSPKGGQEGVGHLPGATAFMSYAGPVFPLTLDRPNASIAATRDISFDFALAGKDSLRGWGSEVTEKYTLWNSSSEDIVTDGIYPFAGSLAKLKEEMPTIKVNGETINPTLYPGGYSGGFTEAMTGNGIGGPFNNIKLDSWEDYEDLLEDGAYLRRAFEDYPFFNQKVIVYKFSDFKAPLEEFSAATQAISFKIDPEKTDILLYGFNGSDYKNNGFRRFSYFVPNEIRRKIDEKYIIVAGEDIGDYILEGFKDGDCKAGNELEGVSAAVTRTEENLSDILLKTVDNFFYLYGADEGISIPNDMFLGLMSQFMLDHRAFSNSPKKWYGYEMLEDVISETKSMDRLFYLSFPMSIPAGQDISLEVSLHKDPSFDFYCPEPENRHVQGYDMVTRLGSNIEFSEITASLRNTENILIHNQNFGFDLDGGIDRVNLDPKVPHYYLEVKPVELK